MRATSRRPTSWISRGPSVVVVDCRTRNSYQAGPSGRSRQAIVSRVRGRYSCVKKACSARNAGAAFASYTR